MWDGWPVKLGSWLVGGPKVECRRLMDFDDAAKLKMCVLTDSGTDHMAGGRTVQKISR